MFTTWLDPRPLVLPKKFPSPTYSAVIACVPCGNEDSVRLAVPRLSPEGEPSGEPSALNCTAPAGVPAPGETAETAAVKVRFDPVRDGLAEDATVMAEDAGVMFSVPLTKLKR